MNNMRRKIFFALTVLGLFLICSDIYVFADDIYKAVGSAQKTWTTQKKDDYIDRYDEEGRYVGTDTIKYYYKMTVPKGVYAVLDESGIGSACLYKNMGDENVIEYFGDKKECYLPKGIYYIRADDGIKFRYTFKTYKNESNYKLSKAKTLKAGKEIVVVQTMEEDYSRWYKIKLNKNNTITFWTKTYGSNEFVSLYNSKFQRLSITDLENGKHYTTNRQKKGVYYFRIHYKRNCVTKYTKDHYDIVHLKWK